MSTPDSTSGENQIKKGLAGAIAGTTSVASVEQGQLLYRGYEIHDLAENATFEDVAHVLLVGHKPSSSELSAFQTELQGMREVPGWIIDVIQRVAPKSHPMDTLRTGISLLSHTDEKTDDISPEDELRKSKKLLACIPTIIGAGQRAIDGKAVVEPDGSLSHAANLLYCMTGDRPSDLMAKVVDVSLILYAEHEFNASTFTGRVIAGTLSDMYSAICGAIGALKGPLHGGANEAAMDMLKEVGTLDNVRPFMDNAFATKRKIMGFGHRVYKNGDHRAPILHAWGRKVAEERPEFKKWFEIGEAVQKIMNDEKGIFPNVDFPCGMAYFALGIPVPQYTPIFVASRITGWCAHVMEQHADNKLIRPLSQYTGEPKRAW
ncbi:MAG: citrate synthase [Planctomycetes bacterium]|nr:citrate synthase [Planctomycetota bacterium]NOG54240.1 citrate synthase [Planctomycetota bacterium]